MLKNAKKEVSRTDRSTDGLTDTVIYRVVSMQLKMRKVWRKTIQVAILRHVNVLNVKDQYRYIEYTKGTKDNIHKRHKRQKPWGASFFLIRVYA